MKIERPICPEGFGEPYVRPEPETPVQATESVLGDLVRAEGYPSLYSPAQRLTLGGRGRRMTRRGIFTMALGAFAALGNAIPAMAFFRGGGGSGGGSGLTLLTTYTLQNPGGTETNVQLRFGQAFKRGAVATTGFTFVLKDDLGNTLPMQYDERSDFNGQSGATDGAWIRHVVFSTIIPTFGSARTISIYKQAGTYSPGTPVSMSAITAQNLVVKFGSATWPTSDCNNAVIGSGQHQFVVNTYAGITFGPNGSGTGIPGGIRQVSSGAVQSTWIVAGALTDVTGGAPFKNLYEEFYAVAWANGRIEFMPKLGNPWFTVTSPTPSLYWGDHSIYSGATLLRSWTQNFPIASADVNPADLTLIAITGAAGSATGTTSFTDLTLSNITGLGFQYGYVGMQIFIEPGSALTSGNYTIMSAPTPQTCTLDRSPGTGSGASWRIGGGSVSNAGAALQEGEPIVFTQGGGATLPTGLTAGKLNFAAVNPSSGVTGIFPCQTSEAYHVTSHGGQGFNTISSAGTGTNTMTRTCTVNNWQGSYLPADDNGNAWFLPVRTATPYPNLTASEKLYWMQTGMVPPYNLAPPPGTGVFFNNYWTDASNQGCGPYYRPNSLGIQPTGISQGGAHIGIGVWSDPSANWWMNSTVANWDQIRAMALSHATMPMMNMLNIATGYIPAGDNGPDQLGTSYPGLGAPFPLYCMYYNNSAVQNFALPQYPALPFAASYTLYFSFWMGVGVSAATEGGVTDHQPEFGMIPQYLMEGQPWMLDEIYRDGNYGVFGFPKFPYDGITNGTMTIPGATPQKQYAKFCWAGQAPRSFAWGMRSPIYSSVVGANSRPEQNYWWSIVGQNIRTMYLIDTVWYGSSPGFGAMGMMSSTGYDSTFMDLYAGQVTNVMYGLIHQDWGAILPGATTLWAANRCIRLMTGLVTNWGISPFWAGLERVWDQIPWTSTPSGNQGASWAASLADIGTCAGVPSIDLPGVACDATGLFTMTAWNGGPAYSPTVVDYNTFYYQNGDQWIPSSANSVALFGTAPLYIVSFTGYISSSVAPTFRLSATSGGSPIVPSAAGTDLEFAPRPLYNPAPPEIAYGPNNNQNPSGYQAEYIAVFAGGLAAGLTEPGIAAAFTQASSRFLPHGTFTSYGRGSVPWCEWYMDSTIRVS